MTGDTPETAAIEQAAEEFLERALTHEENMGIQVRFNNDAWIAKEPALAAISTAIRSRSDLREQGQAEGFAAAISQLRELSAQKPRHSLWHAAATLADSLEQSRQAYSATPITTAGDMG